MGLFRRNGFLFERVIKMMELYIETLTGTAFELRVSPYETVQDVKARIQKLEGIPISQQHLIWQSVELEDDFCLRDYNIGDGATLKLVLTMRGGPINTRRIPVEDQTLRDMAEYISEANRDDFLDKHHGSNKPVTVIVYQNGDQLNFFRIVDHDSNSPSESLSATYLFEEDEEENVGWKQFYRDSVGSGPYQLDDDEEESSGSSGKEKGHENDKTREKMKLLRSKMDNMTVTKKPKKKNLAPRPPSTSRPLSNGGGHLRKYTTSTGHVILNRNPCLPPVSYSTTMHEDDGDTRVSVSSPSQTSRTVRAPSHQGDATAGLLATAAVAEQESAIMDYRSPNGVVPSQPLSGIPSSGTRKRLESLDSAKLKQSPTFLSSVTRRSTSLDAVSTAEAGSRQSGKTATMTHESTSTIPPPGTLESILRRSRLSSRKRNLMPREALMPSSPGFSKELETLRTLASRGPATSSKALERLLDDDSGPSAGPSRKDVVYETLKDTLGAQPSTSKYGGGRTSSEKKQSVILESLDPSEVQAVSGMLSSIVHGTSKNRGSFKLHSAGLRDGHIPTPENRLMSAHLQKLSTARDGRVVSPSHRLPPVKQKKKTTKRCYVCGKKTGLATSYQCRCGNNFCASHRYAESHSCTFDYKTEGRKLLEQNNPVVNAPKLPKI